MLRIPEEFYLYKDKDGQLKVDFGLFCRIYVVKGKEISIFLQI